MSDRTPQEPSPPPASAQEQARIAAEEAAQARKESADALALAEAARDAAVEAAKRAGRFSREFLVTVISVVTTAFGVVVALAWNTALTKALQQISGTQAQVVALFIYALVVTLLAVLAIIILSRLARRIGADPIEFKLGERQP